MMDVNDKISNSVLACSPLSIRDYSPSPSTTKNDTPSTTNTTNTMNTFNTNTSHTTNTNIHSITLPITNIIKLEHTHIHPSIHPSIHYNHIQPSLTCNINNNNKENHIIPRIPLPNIFMNQNLSHLSLPPLPPPLPKEILSANMNKKNNLKPQSEHKKRSRHKRKLKIDTNTQQYSVITSAFNHNLRVKQEHLRDEVIFDTSFENCYIFSMRCPYTDCCKLFTDMTSYQTHHINKHQQRDKKGKLIQSKEAKWKCPECGKISASWYNYAAHVTMHKESCDAPWICKLPPINKKKYVEWTDGTFICGKRCSTKHNLIKHLRALHTNHRIIDLSQSVKAQNHDDNNIRRSPRKNKKRPRFKRTISPLPLDDKSVINVIKSNRQRSLPVFPPPKKKMKMDPHAIPTALPIFSTGEKMENFSVNNDNLVRKQGDFVGLLLEAAQLIETDSKSKTQTPLSASSSTSFSSCDSMPLTIKNVQQLLSSIKSIFNSSANGLSEPICMENFSQLSAVLALSAAVACNSMEMDMDAVNDMNNNCKTQINISNITDIARVSSDIHKNGNINCGPVMPDIAIIPNMPSICGEISPITATNPAISLPKMPLPPPLQQAQTQTSENGLDSLLRLLNYPRIQNTATATNIMLNTNTFNTYNNAIAINNIPLLPNIYNYNSYNYNTAYKPNNFNVLSISNAKDTVNEDNDTVMSSNSVISNNILSVLPPIIMNNNQAKK